ncbi:WD repeat protein Lub1 [Blastocladiella emersonii ATCC 22665]|nr:WD repeat protein Lub1 [Blastocladiella emersonii ATCC 22665]
MTMQADYTLAAVVPAHEQDTKDLVFLSDSVLATCSRDHTARIWQLVPQENGGTDVVLVHTLADHQGFVNAVAAVDGPNSTKLLASGGSDKTIHVHEPENGALVLTLVGHTENVCVLGRIPGVSTGVISGSWDKTARVWINGECVYMLKGHEQAVWGVLALDATTFVTAAADKTIKIWNGDKCVKTVTGHTDVVRALVHIPALDLVASCSNDSTVRVWTRLGELVQELHGHTSFVYKVTVNTATGELVSCGEDRCVRVWLDGELKQTIPLPSVSVWSVAVNPAGTELAAAESNGTVYLFTRDPARAAQADLVKAFEESLASSAIPKNQIGDIKKDDLPGPEALANPGNRDGQVLMVKTEAGNVEAHQWSSGQKMWVKVGDVVDAIGSGRKQVYNGKEYDYVFDIDVGGGQFLKLPYNVAENPYTAAQAFLWKYELSQEFLDQVANFIVTNTKGHTVSTSADAANEFVDPFTGGNRYTPAGSSAPSAFAAQPATGAAGASNASAFSPWTSGYTTSTLSSASSSAAAAPAPATATYSPTSASAGRLAAVPVKEYVTFKQINYGAIANKLAKQQSDFGVTLSPAAGTAAELEEHPWSTATSVLTLPAWPVAERFPALDLVRYFVLSHDEPAQTRQALDWAGEALVAAASHASVMLALRIYANLFHLARNRSAVMARLGEILPHLNTHRGSKNKNVRQSVATVLLNAAVHMVQTKAEAETMNVIAVLAEMLVGEADPETLYRTVAAVGTMAALGSSVKPFLAGLGVRAALMAIQVQPATEERTKFAIADSLALI